MDLPSFPPEILTHVFSFLGPANLLNISAVNKIFSELSTSPDLWKRIFHTKNIPSTYQGEDRTKEEDEGEGKRARKEEGEKQEEKETKKGQEEKSEVQQDWKTMYKFKLKREKELQLQRASAEALKYQSRLAVLLTRKREFNHVMQHLQTKKTKLNTEGQKEKDNLVYLAKSGWHPSDVQKHFDKKKEDVTPPLSLPPPSKPPLSEEVKEAQENEARYLQLCLDSVKKKTKFAEQILEKYTELSHETEQRKRELSMELKKFGK